MKQKIVIRVVGMNCEKSRCKTLKTVVGCACVESAAVKGDKVEVVGDGIDAVCLTRAIRKNVAPADLISVEEHKKKEEKKDDKPAQPVVFFPQSHYPMYAVSHPCPDPYCTIM